MMYKSAFVALLATSVLGLKMQDPAPEVAPPPAAPEPQAADFSIPGMPAAAQAPAAPALPAEAAPALPAEAPPALPAEAAPALPAEAPPAPELAAAATNPPVAAAVTETSAPLSPDMSQAWAAATPSPEMQQAWTNAWGGGAQAPPPAAMPTGDFGSIGASPEVEATIRQTRQGMWDEAVKAMDGRMGKRIQKKIAQSYQNPDTHGDISEEDDPNREWHEKAKDNMVDSVWKFGRSMFPAMVGAYQQGAPTIARVASDMANMQAAR